MKLNWKQIALGVVVYFGVFLGCIVLMLFVDGFWTGIQDLPPTNFEKQPDTSLLWAYLFMDFIAPFIGAYVSAARSDSRKSVLIHACVTVAISTAIASLAYLTESEPYPLWYNVLSYGLILLAAFLGGLWRWRNLQRQHRVLDVARAPLPDVPRPL